MKKLLARASIYCILVILTVLGINWIYTSKKIYTESEEAKFQFIPEEIEICNLGSSHGVHGYYYADLEDTYTCFNMALDSQSLSYDQRILEAYQDNLKQGGVVIIDISYFALWGCSETEVTGFDVMNKRYYKFLPSSMVKEYDWITDIMIHKVPVLSVGGIDVMKTVFLPKVEGVTLRSYPEVTNEIELASLETDVAGSCSRHIFYNKRDEQGELIINQDEIDAVGKMVEICKEHKVTPILVTVPYIQEYCDKIEEEDPTFFQHFYSVVDMMTTEYKVEYFDYARDKRFAQDYSLFYNGDHMNSIGAKKFTEILYEEVLLDRLNTSYDG